MNRRKGLERSMGFSDPPLDDGRLVFTGRITHMVEGPSGKKVWQAPERGQMLSTKKGLFKVDRAEMYTRGRGRGYYFSALGRIVRPFKS